mgnify:FL=1
MKKNDLATEKINKLIISFAIPCVISMIINSIYNIVDQIFIGKGVGTLGNAATNVIFPLVILGNAIAGLIGNGAAANFSLRLGEGNKDNAKKSVGEAITLSIIVSIIFSLISFILLPKLLYFFGCTENVYSYAYDYGIIILIGMPFMIVYSAFSNIIRADGSPKYSMVMLIIGAIINIILDPVFIFGFNLGVKGGAIATVIGQIVSFIIAVVYLKKFKTIKLEKDDFKLSKNILKILSLGLSSFITQLTILVLFVFMNNIMTKFGAKSVYGADIPLSVYGVLSKINSIYVSIILGISIGVQPIIGFNFGAGKIDRVKEVLKKVIILNFLIGIIFNIILYCFPKEIVSFFITNSDANYDLFMEFAVLMCKTFFMVCALNAVEMTTSIAIQSLGHIKKATAVSFIRQIILLIPISLLLCITFNKGIYGVLDAGRISDSITFVIALIIYVNEYKGLSKIKVDDINECANNENKYEGKKIIVTIGREYGSGGHYVGELLAKKLGVNFYDKNIISLVSKESGLSKNYIASNEESLNNAKYESNNDNLIFIAESKVIKKIAKTESCIIVGRCADYILDGNKDVLKVFLYSDEASKINRCVKYYGISKNKALNEIKKIDKERSKHYNFYTNKEWGNVSNYDLLINVDKYGVESTVDLIYNYVINKK